MPLNFYKNDYFHEFSKEFKEEELIWAVYEWCLIHHKMDYQKYWLFLNEKQSFESLLEFINLEFNRCSQREFEHFIHCCRSKRKKLIPYKNLNFLSKDSRLCWLIINTLFRRNLVKDILLDQDFIILNPYYSLLFNIFYSDDVTLQQLQSFRKKLYCDLKPESVLKKYINSSDFNEWALNYTKKNYGWGIEPPPNNPKCNKEAYDLFLIFWDYQCYQNPDKYMLNIQKLKKAWQQKQFRDKGSPKKPYHLPLTKKTKSQLVALAEKMNISEPKVLEKLIEEAYQNEMLDEKGKALY